MFKPFSYSIDQDFDWTTQMNIKTVSSSIANGFRCFTETRDTFINPKYNKKECQSFLLIRNSLEIKLRRRLRGQIWEGSKTSFLVTSIIKKRADECEHYRWCVHKL